MYLFLVRSSVFMTNLLLSICLDRVHNLLLNGKWNNRVLYSILFALNNYICSVPSYSYNVSCLWVISEIFVANGKTFWVVSKSSEISRPIKLCCDWFTANNRTSGGFHGVFASESLRTGQIKLTREEGEGREWCRKTKIAIKNRIRFDNKTWKQVEMKSFWTKNFECHKTVTSFWKLR